MQTASEDWYKKIISGDLLALKIGLLNQGIFISKAALNFIQNYGGIKDSVFDSIDLILNNGIIINCPYKINYADFSPFFLEYFSGQLELHYYDKWGYYSFHGCNVQSLKPCHFHVKLILNPRL